MEKIILKIGIILLLLSLSGVSCNNDEQYPECYRGKVVSLNQGNGCNNIIEIVRTISHVGLAVGTTITFDPNLYGGKLIEGDIVYFKFIQYEEWIGPAYGNCLWPQYTAQIEFCNN